MRPRQEPSWSVFPQDRFTSGVLSFFLKLLTLLLMRPSHRRTRLHSLDRMTSATRSTGDRGGVRARGHSDASATARAGREGSEIRPDNLYSSRNGCAPPRPEKTGSPTASRLVALSAPTEGAAYYARLSSASSQSALNRGTSRRPFTRPARCAPASFQKCTSPLI